MRKCILIIGFNQSEFSNIKWEHINSSILICKLPDLSKAIVELTKTDAFLMVAIFWHTSNDPFIIKKIRCLTNIPIIIVVEKYDGEEKIAVIEAGADEYLLWPDTNREMLASCRALIRRYTVYSRREARQKAVILLEDIFIDSNSCKVFICEKELLIGHHEFNLLSLLASFPERVFTYRQLSFQVWGSDKIPTENSIHSCVKRIRRKMEAIPECPYSIENMRGVGYCLHLNKKAKAALPCR